MDSKMETNSDENTESVSTETPESALNSVLERTLNSHSFKQQMLSIEYITQSLSEEKSIYFELRELFHYFTVLAHKSIEEQFLKPIEKKLSNFYKKIIEVSYHWKCLSVSYENDFRWFNCIQLLLKTIIDTMITTNFDDIVVNKCVPLLLDSMLIIVSTIHGLKEVTLISKPISQLIIERKKRGIDMCSEEWTKLISHVMSFANIWTMICLIETMDQKNFIKTIISLIDYSLGTDPFLKHISRKTFKTISNEKHISLSELFIEYQLEICSHIIHYINIGDHFDISLLYESMALFNIASIPHELLRHIVPYFAVKCDQKTIVVIDEIAKIDVKSNEYVIKVYFTEIIRQIFYGNNFDRSVDNIEEVLEFLSSYSNLDLRYRIRIISFELINSFLLRLSKDYDLTLEGLAFVHHYQKRNGENELNLHYFDNNEVLLRNYLNECFLPFIHKLDAFVINFGITNSEKITAVESFVLLIKFMGKECINTFRVKIFSTIKLIIGEKFYSNPDLIKSSIKALAQFIELMDESYLSSQLLTISALILPLMYSNSFPNETSTLFKELIIKHKDYPQFQSAFKHLYFIPEMEELYEVNRVLKPYITCSESEDDICNNIILVVNNINHENSKVQEFSLRELHKQLIKHQLLLYKKCNDIKEENCDHFVNQIVIKLMSCLKSTEVKVLLLVSECLGVLGAIDPFRIDLDKPILSKEENNEKFLNSVDKSFKIILIKLLMRAITTAEKTEDQYCASYALQEIIKYFTNCNENSINIITDLPQELRDYCVVLQKTKYNNRNPFKSSQVSTDLVFGSTPDLSFNDWITKWSSNLFYSYIFRDKDYNESNNYNELLSQCPTSPHSSSFDDKLEEILIKNSISVDVLNASFHAIIRNQSIAQFLLPYVVITALRNATPEQRKYIVYEVKAICERLSTDGIDGEIGHLCSQTVFHLYDYLKFWSKNRLALHKSLTQLPRHLKLAQIKDREFKGVKYFLSNVSAKELATLAFNCNAFSRSLRYLEDYVKENNDSFENEIPFFQKIYIKLNEPDSVEGCNSKRKNIPSINETILTHEAIDQIQEALICCAKAVQLFPNDFVYQEKFMQLSMESFDQMAIINTYGTGLMLRQPEMRRKLAPYVIEAVWKLGAWDQLEELLVEYENNSLATFGSGIGNLFFSINKKKNENECEEKFHFLRQQLVGPLSAASMEISGYVRGHQYVVNLHVLNDMQLAYNKLITKLNDDCFEIENFKNKFLKVMNIWDKRNGMVRETIKCQEPILNAQRSMLSIIGKECDFVSLLINKQLFKSWLMSTKTSRKSGNIQRSYNCLLEMLKARQSLSIHFGEGTPLLTVTHLTDIENSEAILEAAKVHWARNDKKGALKYLKDEIERNFSESRNYCFLQAIKGLSDKFSNEELVKMTSSLSINTEYTNQLSMSSTSSKSSASLASNRSLESSHSSLISEVPQSHEAFAKLQLLYNKYSDSFGALDLNSLAVMYKSVTIADHNWEESHYSLGMYCHKIYVSYEESQKNSKSYSLGKPEEILDLKGRVVKSLTESLKYGVKHAHNSLPLLLNIWFDLGTELRAKNIDSFYSREITKTLDKITSAINELLKSVPSYIFFICFSQLTARILHPYFPISSTLKSILSKLIIDYPQQSMWLFLRSCNSSNPRRQSCCRDIIDKAIADDKSGVIKNFIHEMKRFAKLMTELCLKTPEPIVSINKVKQRVKQMSFKKDFPDLDKFFSKNNNSFQILLPFESLLSVKLPNSSLNTNYNPFPNRNIYIRGFEDCIELLNSLQKPKKIKIKGSDGKTYTILCKPNDDLRKDNCVIEFSNLLNRCFKRDPQTRRRQLKVKSYFVVPLNDTCGLIEWVTGLLPFRQLIENQYRINVNFDEIRNKVVQKFPTNKEKTSQRVQKFETEILPKFCPPVFSQWFLTSYSDPLSWFLARLTYVRSSAVFSIIGYLLGLGDRHGENIMIDENSGETVHVDLNCLFNKGEDFQYPEEVPFRLTHNMIDGMGVTQFEGTFRKACEHTLHVARDNKLALMNFIMPFRFDHLIEWYKSDENTQIRFASYESTLEHAEKIVFNVEARLNGIPDRNHKNLPKGIPLSVEGQVDHVIKESIDPNNLGVMYVGWAPYL